MSIESMLALCAQAPRVQANPGTRIPPAWSFDVDAIERACDTLGVSEPVVIGCAEYPRGRTSGIHFETLRSRGHHKIHVRRAASPQEASRILWHELTHALQTERDGGPNTNAIRRERGYDAYHASAAEVEARGNERHAREHPLVRAL